MHMHIHSNIKEYVFTMFAVSPIIANYWLQKGYKYLYSISLISKQTYTFADKLLNGLNFLGGNGGIMTLALSFILGYYLCCIAPFQYSKIKGGRS